MSTIKVDWQLTLTVYRCGECGRAWADERANLYGTCKTCAVKNVESARDFYRDQSKKFELSNIALRGVITRLRGKK